MATPKRQRIGILIILIVTVVGTLGSFAVLILNTKSSQEEQTAYNTAYAKYQADYSAYQKKVDAQATELSGKYYSTFEKYASYPAKYDIDSVKELTTKDLVVGSGETVSGTTKFAAYYIGWQSDGSVFDESINSGSLKSPLSVDGLDSASLISGWKKGLIGMKIGGVRELSIPSDLAYGESGQTDSSGKQTIAPNMPLKFIVMAIEQPETIEQPSIPSELLSGY